MRVFLFLIILIISIQIVLTQEEVDDEVSDVKHHKSGWTSMWSAIQKKFKNSAGSSHKKNSDIKQTEDEEDEDTEKEHEKGSDDDEGEKDTEEDEEEDEEKEDEKEDEKNEKEDEEDEEKEDEEKEEDEESDDKQYKLTQDRLKHTNQVKNVEIQNASEIANNYPQEETPNQMALIEKGLVYTRPKANEIWIIKEEGTITWAISNLLVSKAHKILMNCNLYQDGKMILSVFKGVPLIIGTESWTPPTFLEPSSNYQLRLWSQPSEVGIINEYSPKFSIVPQVDDKFMFSYNKSVVMNNATLPPETRVRVGQNDLPPINAPEPSNAMLVPINNNNNHNNINNVSNKTVASVSSSITDPNIPTGIYALYPSLAKSNYNHNNVELLLFVSGFWAVYNAFVY